MTTTTSAAGTATTQCSIEESLGIVSYLTETKNGFRGISKARYSDFLVYEVSLEHQVAHLTASEAAKEKETNGSDDDNDNKRKREDSNDNDITDCNDNDTKSNDNDDKEDSKKETSPTQQEQARVELMDLIQRTVTHCNHDDSLATDQQSSPQSASDIFDRIWQWTQAQGSQSSHGHATSNTNNESPPNKKTKSEIPDASNDKNTSSTPSAPPAPRYLSVWLQPAASKTDRQAWHALMKEPNWSSTILTDTHKVSNETKQYTHAIRLWKREFETQMPNYRAYENGNPRGGGRRPGKRGQDEKEPIDPKYPYWQFVLYKENMDTGAALGYVQSQLSGGGGRGRGGRGHHHNRNTAKLGHAGMKDKRGITCQFVTCQRKQVTRQKLMQLATTKQTMRNGASIVRIGSIQPAAQDLRLGRLLGNRFGVVLRNVQASSSSDNETSTTTLAAMVQECVTSLQDRGFINYFGTQRFGKYHDTHWTGVAVLQGNYQKAVEIILRASGDERPNIQQARAAWEKRLDGVAADNMEAQKKAEKQAAQALLNECGRFMHNERVVCQSLVQKPLDYKRAYGRIPKTMRMMFVHAVQSWIWNHLATYRCKESPTDTIVGDLVVVKGDESSSPDAWPEVHVVTQEDVGQQRYRVDDIVLPMIGKKTMLPTYAKTVLEPLLQTHGLEWQHLLEHSDPDFGWKGDYRKWIGRPSNVEYDVLQYRNPIEPLVQTDWMKMQKEELSPDVLVVSSGETPPKDEDPNSRPALYGLRVFFTLPSSAYATIALRELMKCPTSSEFQGTLSMEHAAPKDDETKVEASNPAK